MIPKWDRLRRIHLAGGSLPVDSAQVDVDRILAEDGIVELDETTVRLTASGRAKAAHLFGRPPG